MPIIPDLTPSTGNWTPAAPSPQVAAAPGLALAAVGQDIFGLGEEIGTRLQAAQDNGAKNSARLAMQQAFLEHQTFRAQNLDESTWGPDMEARIAKARESAFKQRMSPFMKTELNATFQGWADQAAGGVRADAGKQTMARARQNVTNTAEAYIQSGRHEDARGVLREGVAAGVMLPEDAASDMNRINAEEKTWQEKETEKRETSEILRDSKGFLDANPPGKKYPPGTDLGKIERQRREALQKFNSDQHEFATSIRDGMISQDGNPPKITKPEQIAELGKHIASPATIEILTGELADRYDAKKQALYLTPEHQNQTVGTIADLLDGFDPNDSTKAIQIAGELKKLPDGFLKRYYSAEAEAKFKGKPEDVTSLKLNLMLVDDAAKGGYFNRIDTPVPQNTKTAVNRGFLTDKNRLTALGADGNQADDIMYGYHDAASKQALKAALKGTREKDITDDELKAIWTNEKRAEKFRETYGWFTHATTAKPDAYTAATAKAIDQGYDNIRFVDPKEAEAAMSDKMQARIAKGQVVRELIKWHRVNPKATEPEIRAALVAILGPTRNAAFMRSAFSAGLGDDDATGMVLPPKNRQPDADAIDPYAVDPSTLPVLPP